MNKKTIVVFGESGAGKTSFVNLISGRQELPTTSAEEKICFDFLKYECPKYIIYEVVGYAGIGNPFTVISHLLSFLHSLEGGVNLLIQVSRKGRITDEMEKNYYLFKDKVFLGKVPVILILSHCEDDIEQGAWWRKEREGIMKSYRFKYESVVSCCLTRGNHTSHPIFRAIMDEVFQQSQERVPKCVENVALDNPIRMDGYWNWLYSLCSSSMQIIVDSLPIPNLGVMQIVHSVGTYLFPEREIGANESLEWTEGSMVFVDMQQNKND